MPTVYPSSPGNTYPVFITSFYVQPTSRLFGLTSSPANSSLNPSWARRSCRCVY
jgi:hypothetical protein